jgi:putative transposase
VQALREAVRLTGAERPFDIDAWVVLPDHLHCVWTLPEGDADYSTRWGAIKGRFTNTLRRSGLAPTLPPRNAYGARAGRRREGDGRVGASPDLRGVLGTSGFTQSERAEVAARVGASPDLRGEGPVWQKRFWEHHLRDEQDFRAHVRYCWANPVKHGLVADPAEWPYSTYHRDGAPPVKDAHSLRTFRAAKV